MSLTYAQANIGTSLPAPAPAAPTPVDTVSGWVKQNPQPISTPSSTIQQGIQGASQNISSLQGQMNSYDQSSEYPAFPNAYGLGGPMDNSAQGASSPGYAQQPLTQTAPDTASRGFNPWSLTGEANARGR